ncbi:hypothetical protein Taro_042127, partial [Colocasia esculenta]|nr:hypothetical protein [Colocasia esculenta]
SIDKKLRDNITSTLTAFQIGDETLLLFFLKTCQLEFEMKHLYFEILEGRDALWDESKHRASDRMKEISHFFCGSWVGNCDFPLVGCTTIFRKLLIIIVIILGYPRLLMKISFGKI